jgi:hypothetical protein
MIGCHMMNIAHIEEINDHLRRFSRTGRLVAIARGLRKDEGRYSN